MHGILKKVIVGVAALSSMGGALCAQGTACDSPCVLMRLPLIGPPEQPVPNSNPLAELQGKVSGANIMGQGVERVYSEYEVEKPVAEIHNGAAPQYPDAMLDRKAGGLVTTTYIVGIDGRIDTATFRVVASSGELFTAAVRDVIPRIRYVPAQLHGKPVRQVVKRTFDFNPRLAMPCESPCPFMYLPLESPPSTTMQAKAPFIVGKITEMDVLVGHPAFLFEYQVDRPAMQRKGTIMPEYPDSLKKAKIDGEVVASFVVDSTGSVKVESIQILNATHQFFAVAVLDALPKMKYVPAELHGVKVSQLVQAPFIFHIRK